MHRLTIKRTISTFLLLAALLGNLAPMVLAATAPPPQCCIRKAAHHCHDSAAAAQLSETGRLAIHDAACCNHDCCRAVTTARWAHAQSSPCALFVQNVEAYLGQSCPVASNLEVSRSQSTRAPPGC
jgi:hypothetical protein